MLGFANSSIGFPISAVGLCKALDNGVLLEACAFNEQKHNMQEKPSIPADISTLGVKSGDAGKGNL